MNIDIPVRVRKWVGYPLFAIFVFILSLYVTFPYHKIKTRLEDMVSANEGMELSIGSMGPSPLFGVSAKDVVLRLTKKGGAEAPPDLDASATEASDEAAAPPKKAKAKADPVMRITLDRVSVSVGLLRLIGGTIAASYSVSGFGGELSGDYVTHKKTGTSVAAKAEKLKLSDMPFVTSAVGLPLSGTLSFEVDLKVDKGQLENAAGTLEVSCDACVVGDGKQKLKVPGNPMLAMGITLPKLEIGRLQGLVKVDKGVATFEQFGAKSGDLEMDLEGTIGLRQPLAFSTLDAYLRFKISPQLKQKDAKFELLESSLSSARRPDGFFGMRLFGNLGKPQAVPSKLGLPKK